MIPEHPFAPAHSRESFLETVSGQEALRRLEDGLGSREPFVLLTGAPGTGKTALVREALARWGPRVTAAFVAYPALAGGELLEEVIRRFGADPPEGASQPRLVACLEHVLAEIAARDQVALIVVDDAHDLSAELLEDLRLLVNAALLAHRPLEVLLVGLPSLEARLAAPGLAALHQRISVRANVTPLSPAETQRYVHHRVTAAGGDGPGQFSRRTCRDLATLTGGVPRRINTLASEALRLARASGQPTVTPEHVQAAATGLWGTGAVTGVPAADDAELPDAAPPENAPRAGATVPAPAPPAEATVTAIAPAVAPPASAPRVVTPASQNAQEWVARFVGDKGPLQLSSRAFAEPKWAPEPSGSIAAESEGPGAKSAATPRRRPGVALPPLRSSRRRGLRVPATASLAAVIVLGAVALIIRAGVPGRGPAGHATRAATIATTPREGASAAATMPVTTSVRPQSVAGPAAAGDRGAGARPDSAANARRRYTIDVGGYIDLQQALDRRDRLRDATGIEGWVVVTSEFGVESYRIVLGIFRTPERATSGADQLLSNGKVSEATVVPLPRRRTRR